MKKTFFLFLLVPVILIALFIENANTQTDPGLIKWMQDQDRQIQSNRQMINHEQRQRFELESRLIKMMQNDIKNVRQHINNLQFEIREMQNRLSKHEDNIRNPAQ